MSESRGSRRRPRGNIESLANGSLRVRVYAGIDPVTKRPHYLRETVPAGPRARRAADKVLTRLLNQVDERRNPRTSATVAQLLQRYLESHFDGEPRTRDQYWRYARKHVLPFVGEQKVGAVDAETLDSLYAELRRCRVHCTGRKRIDHRTERPHECDDRCGPHRCRPLGANTVRHVHYLLSGAFKRAVRWNWVTANPAELVEPPPMPPASPKPPSVDEAAQIINEAWRREADWGALVWLAMTTGARRGELCALRWRDVALDSGLVVFERAIAWDPDARAWFEKDTKTHQGRRVALDQETAAVLREHSERCQQRAAALGTTSSPETFVFSPQPDGGAWLVPSSVSQRYDRMVSRLGVATTLHKLRHYSATELISSGVDVRTVAGRLGHGSGGVTTLRTYSAWVSEADQRAASVLSGRMPQRPEPAAESPEQARVTPKSTFEHMAHSLRRAIADGRLHEGEPVPALKRIAAEHDVAEGTAHRAVSLLKSWGLVDGARGRPNTVIFGAAEIAADGSFTDGAHEESVDQEAVSASAESARSAPARESLEFEVRRWDEVVRRFRATADPDNDQHLHRLLAAAVRRDGRDASEIIDYELDVRRPDGEKVTTFVALEPE